VESLGPPTGICDVRRAVKTVTGTSTDVFIAKSNLRPLCEILDEGDFIYRCHWAVKDAQAKGEAIPAGLDPGVVIERHIALNWLRTYHSEAWDDVSADT
jgi:predicted homoserine dehydrogenase-like protein